MECLYLIVSVALFVSCTKILGNDFACYLPNLLSFDKWDERNNEGNGKYPSPLDVLFPAVGLCDVSIGRRDLITKHFNELTVICEMSVNVIYRYCFMIVWLILISCVTASCIGVMRSIIELFQKFFVSKRRHLTLYQLELYEELKDHDIGKFYDVIKNMSKNNNHPDNHVELVLSKSNNL